MNRAIRRPAAPRPDLAEVRRPLFLDTPERAAIDIDGAALRISTQDAAPRWYPLRLVSRILANDQAQFSTAALLACAEAGITLIFIANCGAIRARLLGIPGTRQQTRQRLIDLQFLPDWRDRYNRWRWVTEWWVIDRLRPRLGIPARLAHLAEIQAWLRFEVQRHCDPDTDATSYRWLAELSHAWRTEQTPARGFGARSELWLDGGPDLVGHLAALHAWHLEPLRLGWLRARAEAARHVQRPPHPIRRWDLVCLYQAHAAQLAQQCRAILDRLHLWLVEQA